MIIVKKPEFENDDYLIRIDVEKIPIGLSAAKILAKSSESLAAYYIAKRSAFLNKDINPNAFANFIDDRPSLRMLLNLEALDSTVYTAACEIENEIDYQSLIDRVKLHLKLKPNTRRCVVRFVNSFQKYSSSELIKHNDVTCLSLVHYLKSGPKLVFRASDIKNELLIDLLTIIEFFIKPVYDSSELQISIYSSTAQEVSSWQKFICDVERLYETKA